MFTIVQCENQRKGLAKLFVRRRYYFDMVSERDIRFMLLTINDKTKIDWERVRKILGKTTRQTLVQSDISLPDDAGISAPDTDEYDIQLACNAGESLLKNLSLPQEEIRVTLLDEHADYPAFARMALKYCGSLTIITDHRERYENFGQTAQEEDGAVTFVTDEINHLENSTLILAPVLTRRFADAIKAVRPLAIAGKVEDGVALQGTVMTSFRAELPARYLEYLPPKIDPYQYAAALFTCCHAKKLGQLLPNRCDIVVNGQIAAKGAEFKRGL